MADHETEDRDPQGLAEILAEIDATRARAVFPSLEDRSHFFRRLVHLSRKNLALTIAGMAPQPNENPAPLGSDFLYLLADRMDRMEQAIRDLVEDSGQMDNRSGEQRREFATTIAARAGVYL